MKRSHLKFHIIAVSIISAIIILMFLLLDKPATQGGTVELIGDRYIQIDSATWGRNCDPYVDAAIANWSTDKNTKAPKPQKGALNNVLSAVSSACNGKLECELSADSKTLGTETVASCYKRLHIGYRCYDYDRLTTVETGQGSKLNINCRENGASAPTAPAAAK